MVCLEEPLGNVIANSRDREEIKKHPLISHCRKSPPTWRRYFVYKKIIPDSCKTASKNIDQLSSKKKLFFFSKQVRHFGAAMLLLYFFQTPFTKTIGIFFQKFLTKNCNVLLYHLCGPCMCPGAGGSQFTALSADRN